MNVDASMMANLIQATNFQGVNSVKVDTSTSANKSTFKNLLANALNTENKAENVGNSTTVENKNEALLQLLMSLLESNTEEAQKDEDAMSALLQLLMQGTDEQRQEQLDDSLNSEEKEEAMSLMSMLMNIGITQTTSNDFQNSSMNEAVSMDISMMQMEHRLNQVVMTMSNETSKEESTSLLETLMQASNLSVKNESTNGQITTEKVNVVTSDSNSLFHVQTTTSLQESEQVSKVNSEVQNSFMKEQSNNDIFLHENEKNTELEGLATSVKVIKSEQSDFEKAYQEMQAYRANVNTTAKIQDMPKMSEAKEVVQVNKSDVLNQINESMKAWNQIKDEFVIKLKPEGLGEIVVKLQSEANGKNLLSLVVNNQNVKNILESDLQGLKAALTQTNVEVKEVVFDDQSQYFQQSNFMEGNSFYQNREQSSQANQTSTYQYDNDEQEAMMQEQIVVQSDSLIHQYV